MFNTFWLSLKVRYKRIVNLSATQSGEILYNRKIFLTLVSASPNNILLMIITHKYFLRRVNKVMDVIQLGFFVETLVTISSDLIGSARSWWKNKKTKRQSRRAQSRRTRVESRTQAQSGKTRTKCRRTTTIKKSM